MFKASVVALALAMTFSSNVFAAEEKKTEGQSTIKIEDAADQKNKVKGEDVDEVITNKKMRAEAGSKSKHSLDTAIAYSGSTLEKPFADKRPNLRGRADQTSVASLGGSIAYKYSMPNRSAIKLGVGVRWITPLGGSSVPDSYARQGGKKNDFDNPSVTFQKVYKWGPGIQSVMNVGPTLYTQENLREAGLQYNLGISQNNAVELGTSGFSIGLLLGLSGNTYDKNSPAAQRGQQDYEFGAYPFAEYVINDTFNLRTIVGQWTYRHNRPEKRTLTFTKDTIYQSIGLGISLSRNVFLYPNVQIVPGDIRSDRTNVAMSTNINVF